MPRFIVEGHVDGEGNLSLKLQTGLPESNVRVEVNVEPVTASAIHPSWPRDFVEKFAGVIDDDTFVRPPQPEVEECKTRRGAAGAKLRAMFLSTIGLEKNYRSRFSTPAAPLWNSVTPPLGGT
jgi:hypothetical protein